MSESDALVVIGVAIAATFGFLSFLNTLGIHFAVRHLKKRITRILDRIDGVMDDPTSALAPHVSKFVERMNDDEGLRTSIHAGITFAVKTMMGAAGLKDEVKLDKNGKPIPGSDAPKPKGIIGQVVAAAKVLADLGIIKLPGGPK